jgi:SAM-dependent methyltransferase
MVNDLQTRYADIADQLRSAYDGSAAERDAGSKEDWKLAERQVFLHRLRTEGRMSLLEVGAGTGQDSLYFKDHGVSVVATDLSAEMVARCRVKGVEAYAMDFLQLNFPSQSFDAAYAFNCLLHVPNADLPDVLAAIRKVLKPGGLFYAGLYGGESFEGVLPDDSHDPPRFFSFRTDDQMRSFVEPYFEVLDFHVVKGQVRFQALTLRVPELF